LLSYDPKRRPTSREALHNPWVQKYVGIRPIANKEIMATLENLLNFHTQILFQRAILSYIASQELTRAEESELKQTLICIDVNKNGYITEKDLVNAYQRLNVKKEVAIANARQIMKNIDLTGNNKIEYNEFLMANLNKRGLLTKKQIHKAFNYFDSVQSHFLSIE
jgi:Ca2+-binding EF-hand superfamily protein